MSAERWDPVDVTVDVVGSFLVVAIALAGLSTTFAGTGWLVLGLAMTAVGVLGALVILAWGRGMGLLAAFVVGVHFFTLGPFALRDPQAFVGVSGTTALQTELTATVAAWGRLAGTLPPVDSAGVVMVVPFVLGLVGGASTAGLALRLRHPGAPVLPTLVIWTVTLLLSREQPVSVWVQGGATAVLAVVWIAHRGMRRPASSVRVPWSRIAVSSLLVLVAVGVAVPFAGATSASLGDRTVLREVWRLEYEVSRIETPLEGFRRFRPQPNSFEQNVARRELLMVQGAPPGTRLRFVALERYDGEEWQAANGRDPIRRDDRYLHVSTRVENPAAGPVTLVRVTVRRPWRSPWVPLAGALQGFRFLDESRDLQSQLRFNPASGTAVLPQDLGPGDDYQFSTVLGEDRLSSRMTAYPRQDPALVEVARAVRTPALAWSAGARTPMDAVFRIARTLRERGRYSDGASEWERAAFPPGHDLDRLRRGFLTGPRMVGNDEQYAAAMALLATQVGVPARVVVGAEVPRSGRIEGADVSAWVELRVADGSWRVLPTTAFMSLRPPRRVERSLPPVTAPPVTPEPPRVDPPVQREPAPAEAGSEAPSDSDDGWSWWWLALGATPLAIPVAKGVRRARRRRAPRASTRYAGAWQEFLDHARDVGRPVPAYEPRPGQAERLGRGRDLAVLADVRIFGPADPDPDEARTFWEQVDGLRRDQAREAPVWRRAWAPFNPASLRRPRAGR